jgi:hypothetical protein
VCCKCMRGALRGGAIEEPRTPEEEEEEPSSVLVCGCALDA